MDEDTYEMVDRWLSTTPQESIKAITLKEASAEAILKAASLSRMSTFNKLNKRLHKIIDTMSRRALADNLTKEVEMLRAIRQEAEQLLGPMSKTEQVQGSAAPNVNLQLAFLTNVPTQIEEKPASIKLIEKAS